MTSYHGEGPYEMDATGWLFARATDAVASATAAANRTTNSSSFATSSGRYNQSTAMIINEFRFAAAKSIRTSTIILAIFNVIAAFATVTGILWDNYSRAKRNRGFSIRRDGLNFVQASEVYPLFLSVGIIIQGIIFAVAQSQGLDGLFTKGCTLIAQSMLPALFIVPAIQVIFGLETTMRAFRSRPFPKRHPWAVRMCLLLVALSFLVGYLVAAISRSADFCFASLFWFVSQYSLGCFIVLLAVSAILTLCAVIIFWKLSKSICVEVSERIAASRMVYYLLLAMISNTLMLPFFFHMSFIDQRDPRFQGLNLSMVASVVAEVSGLITGGLHLFLRSNTVSSIGPKDKSGEYERQKLKHRIRVRGPSDASDRGPRDFILSTRLRRIDSDASTSSLLKDEEGSVDGRNRPTTSKGFINPLRANAVYPRPPEPSHESFTTRGSRLTNAFSMFRPGSSKGPRSSSTTLLPATTYSPGSSSAASTKAGRFDFSTLKPPPSIKNIGRHRRDSSMASHITVQLGIRLSNVEDMPPLGARASCESTIPLVNQTGDGRVPVPQPQQPPLPAPQKWAPRPSPLVAATTRPDGSDTSPSGSRTADSDVDEEVVLDGSPVRDPVKDARMKTLPPVPAPIQTAAPRSPVWRKMEAVKASSSSPTGGETLSPTVYSPNSQRTASPSALASGPTAPSPTAAAAAAKIPSPRGVGFTSTAGVGRFNSTSQRSPPPRNGSVVTPTNPAAKLPPPSDKGSDWI